MRRASRSEHERHVGRRHRWRRASGQGNLPAARPAPEIGVRSSPAWHRAVERPPVAWPHAPPTTLRIGAHVDQTDPVAEAMARETTLVQFFLGDPQSYKGPEVRYAGGADGLRPTPRRRASTSTSTRPTSSTSPPRTTGSASRSRKLLQQHMDAAAEIGAKGLIVHGGHVNQDDDPEKGFDNWRKAIEATDLKIPLLIENTAGGDNAMARHAERIGRVFEAVHQRRGRRHGRVLPRHLPRPRRRHRAGHRGRAAAGRSPAASTWSTPTTAATPSTPAPTATPASASGHVDHDAFVEVIRAAGRPGHRRDPRRPRGAPGRLRLAPLPACGQSRGAGNDPATTVGTGPISA